MVCCNSRYAQLIGNKMNIEELLSEYGIEQAPEGHHHRTHNFHQVDCQRCSPDSHSWRLGIHKSGTYAVCWVCGSIPIVEALAELTGLSYSQVKTLLKDIHPDFVESVRKTGKLVLPKCIKPLSELPQHRRYLKERKYDWKELERLWKIQGIGIAPKYSWRIFIPILYHGDTVSWTTRTISKQKDIVRYYSAPEEQEAISHKTLLYGEDYASHAIVICEGPFDVWRVGPGAVCTFGTGFETAQVNRMIQYPVRAVCYDNEKEAQKKARKLVDMLSVFPGETYNVELDAKDPGEANEKEIERLRKEILK